MNIRTNLCMCKIIIVRLHKLAACLVIQATLWEWYDKQAADYFKYVPQRPLARVPVFFKRIYAYVTAWLRHVWMIDFGHEVPFWWSGWEVTVNYKFATKDSSVIWCANWSKYVCLHVEHISVFIWMEYHT